MNGVKPCCVNRVQVGRFKPKYETGVAPLLEKWLAAEPTVVALVLLSCVVCYAANWVDKQPLLLVSGRTFLDDNLKRAKVTRADVFGKLREANAFNDDQILAVVFETTGDISVLHSTDSNAELDADFLKDVIGFQHLNQVHS